jgi:hypothetical protein
VAGASRPRLVQTPALQEKWQREQLEAVPYFDGLMVGEHDALVESFAVHSGTDGLRVFYEQLFSNDGGIPLEHCALVDDGRACALEYNVVRWGQDGATAAGRRRRICSRPERQARRGAHLRRH